MSSNSSKNVSSSFVIILRYKLRSSELAISKLLLYFILFFSLVLFLTILIDEVMTELAIDPPIPIIQGLLKNYQSF